MAMQIVPAVTAADLEQARALFRAYAAESQLDLCFQGFDEELATLPGKYAPPQGCLLLARADETATGCGALRSLGQDVCEMKRLFVAPAFRGRGAGRRLAVALLAEACHIGYRAMRLDTLDSMHAALALYESLGFRRIPAYYDNPLPGVVYLERRLK